MHRSGQTLLEDRWTLPPWIGMTILACILLLAASLRLVHFGTSPPGLNQDEAANAWSSYCLLKTGKDQAGVSWPIFYTRGLGGNRTTLYIYLMLPFQAVGGMNIWTTRLPGIIFGGVLSVFLVYYVGKRLFDQTVGLSAAFLLSINPWHLQLTRWGHEASLCVLLGIAPLALMLWARIGPGLGETKRPGVVRAAIAGILAGVCCYGYHSVRIFIPLFFVAIFLADIKNWCLLLKTRDGIAATTAFASGFLLVFAPLAWQHLFNPEQISRHSQFQELILTSGPLLAAIRETLLYYLRHFGLDFLFINGDLDIRYATRGTGQFLWYMLPLMLAGLMCLVGRCRRSRSGRILLAAALIYPVGDCLYKGVSMNLSELPAAEYSLMRAGEFFYTGESLNSLRAMPGMFSLVLVAAVGLVFIGNLLGRWKYVLYAYRIALIIAIAAMSTPFMMRFFKDYKEVPIVYHVYHADLDEACRWVGPKLGRADAVIFTTDLMNQPYIISLVSMNYDPRQWLTDEKEVITPGEWDFYKRYGKIYFLYDNSYESKLEELRNNGREDHVLFIVRPGELGLTDPIHQITGPDGKPSLWIHEMTL